MPRQSHPRGKYSRHLDPYAAQQAERIRGRRRAHPGAPWRQRGSVRRLTSAFENTDCRRLALSRCRRLSSALRLCPLAPCCHSMTREDGCSRAVDQCCECPAALSSNSC
ncbi:MAG: hypothetical protein R3D62_16710 [Xanthobacteraceae bacterium]